MNEVKSNVCCACLAPDRQMFLIEDQSTKQCFYQIISELSMLYMTEEQLKLCWECEWYMRKWTKFKEQVKYAYRSMYDSHKFTPKNLHSSLTMKLLYNFGITPFEGEVDVLQIIKEEKESNGIESSRNCYQINILHDCDNNFDTFLPKNGLTLSNIDTCQSKNDSYKTNNDSLQSNANNGAENNILLSNDERKSTGNGSGVSKKDIFLLNYDTNDDMDFTAVKVDESDDEFLVTLTKDLNRKKRKGKLRRQREKDCFNGRGHLKKKKTKKISELYREIKLSREELRNEKKMAELKEDYINAMFKCDSCIISFPNSDDLADHVTLKHELHASKHKCSLCECSFSSAMSYNYHKKKHKIRYECIICGERFMTSRSVTKHYEMSHWHSLDTNNVYNNAEIHAELHKTENVLLNDGSVLSERFPCEFCDKTFKWKTSLRKHLETHSIQTGVKRKPYCEPCRLSFSTTSNLRKHVKSSSNHQIQLKLIKLKETQSEDLNSEKQVARIKQIKTSVLKSTQQFRCPHCDRMFQWRGNLHRHIANHAARASGELVCKPCNRTFSSIETYNQHMKISKKHVTENVFKFVCNECGKRFLDKIKLKDHIDWDHLKNYVHICTLCEKVFKSRTSLFLHHRAVHKKDKLEYLCDHCGKAFPNHGRLRSHIVLHTNETPYKCVICPARFNWQACLSRHVKKVHGTQKRHKQDGGARN
ncbi:hypothetical protein K1T71_000712 [Dendrolimus kikuchii]|uniref:Uncharacterized protein n=1 Tax=Dendrolimus kikuchii TaxID=765133 RepID=A0ACC1DK27_9NEOP|nr:hypothetical protein K1T71_000712 [Dendrolimus kikuchii]